MVVLSDGLWKRRFGADPEIVGRSVTLNARTYTIVGVMPPGFKGLTDSAELWVPFAVYAPPQAMANRGNRGFGALARLKPGVTVASAQSELDGISRQLEQAYPDTNEKRGVEVSPLDVELFGALRPALLTLMAAVAFVLLIACANVANLLIARSEARRREIAVRTALGAGRGRLLRQLITESCVLTVLGAVGRPAARARSGRRADRAEPGDVSELRHAGPGSPRRGVHHRRVAGVRDSRRPRAGLAGALGRSQQRAQGDRARQRRPPLAARAQRPRRRRGVAGRRAARRRRPDDPLGPEPDGARSRLRSDVGADAARQHSARIGAGSPGRPRQRSPAPSEPVVRGRALLERIRAVPGVAAVALGTDLPLDGNASAARYAAEGMPPTTAQNVPRAYMHRISPDFFSTLRIPIVAGRTFTDDELTPTSPAVIVSERVVKRFWPGQDPIGKRIKFGQLTSSANPWLSIVGVVGEVKYRGLPENPTADPDIYLPFVERNSQYALAVRATVPPSSLVAPLRAVDSQRRSVDSDLPGRDHGRADRGDRPRSRASRCG